MVINPQTIKVVSKVGRGGILGALSSIWGILKKVFNKHAITLIFLFMILFSSISEMREQKSPVPLITNIGVELINADRSVGLEVDRIQSSDKPQWIRGEEGFLNIFKSFFKFLWEWLILIVVLFRKLWFIYVTYLLIYWLWGHSPISDVSSSGKNVIFAITTIFCIWLITSLFFLSADLNDGKIKLDTTEESPFYARANEIFFKIIPFRGVGKFFVMILSVIPFLDEKFILWGLK